MTQNILVSTFADFERARNKAGAPADYPWESFVAAMVDGLLGLWTAPAS